jgi:Putative transmembrane protein (PGPGW)
VSSVHGSPDAAEDPESEPPKPAEPEVVAGPDGPGPRRQQFREAALRAEYGTGERERTEAEAERRIFARLATICAGTTVCVVGSAMLVLPGPGVVVLIIGLGILAQEVAWADRLLDEVKRRTHVDQLERQPGWIKAVAIVGAVSAGIASTVWFLAR